MTGVKIGVRDYEESDLDATERIWREVGWIENDRQAEALPIAMRSGRAEVGTIDGVPESLVHRTAGTVCDLDTELELCAITAVTTSRTARRMGFASRLTARGRCEPEPPPGPSWPRSRCSTRASTTGSVSARAATCSGTGSTQRR